MSRSGSSVVWPGFIRVCISLDSFIEAKLGYQVALDDRGGHSRELEVSSED
jgi:hypothetical protein